MTPETRAAQMDAIIAAARSRGAASADPIVIALAAGIREIAARRAAERAERRRRMTVLDGGGGGAAAMVQKATGGPAS